MISGHHTTAANSGWRLKRSPGATKSHLGQRLRTNRPRLLGPTRMDGSRLVCHRPRTRGSPSDETPTSLTSDPTPRPHAGPSSGPRNSLRNLATTLPRTDAPSRTYKPFFPLPHPSPIIYHPPRPNQPSANHPPLTSDYHGRSRSIALPSREGCDPSQLCYIHGLRHGRHLNKDCRDQQEEERVLQQRSEETKRRWKNFWPKSPRVQKSSINHGPIETQPY
jgi:hypothetical protein